jgi:signal transduction histidine kinase
MRASSSAIAQHKLVLGASAAVMALGGAALFMIPSTVLNTLSSNFMPHAMCYLYNKQLIALHVGSDAAIWLAYVAISGTLVYLVWRTRKEIPFSWMFLAFGLFIVACGFTHFMEIIVLWYPLYWLGGDIKLLTAMASVVTAIALPSLVPQAHAMVTAARLSEDRRIQLEKANTELQHLSSQVMSVQDAERRRIARELHDGVGQYLIAIKMSCEVALRNRADADKSLQDSLSLLDRCTAEVRTISYLLHPPLLEEMGLTSAIPWYVQGFTERSGIAVDLDMPSRLDRLSQPLELVLFRVLQESLTNIHRHSGSETATIRIRLENGNVLLAIGDRGKGFGNRNTETNKSGVGIASMRERVREFGGDLKIDSQATGTTVTAVIPLTE